MTVTSPFRAASIPFRLVTAPLLLQVVALSLLYLGEGLPSGELDIWIPWTAIVLLVSTLLFAVFWLGYRVRNIAVRVVALLAVLLFAFFGFFVAAGGGDPLSLLPIAVQSVLCLIYFAVLVRRLVQSLSGMPLVAHFHSAGEWDNPVDRPVENVLPQAIRTGSLDIRRSGTDPVT